MIDMRTGARKLLLAGAWWSGASALAAPFLAQAGAILMLHRITARNVSPLGLNSHLSVTPDFLDRLLADLKRRGASLVSMDELTDALAKGRSRGTVALTADDGWLDNLTEGLPVLEAHGAPMTLYVAPGLTDGTVAPWWEVVEEFVAARDRVTVPMDGGSVTFDCPTPRDGKRAAAAISRHVAATVPEHEQQAYLRDIGALARPAHPRRFLSWDELRGLSAHPLVSLGAHTVGHFNLKRLDAADALHEMTESAAIVERETGIRPAHFAYPYGFAAAVGAREVELAAQAGFRSAVTTRHGVLHPDHARHPHALPRISVNGHFQRLSYMRTLLSGVVTPLANGGKRLVTV